MQTPSSGGARATSLLMLIACCALSGPTALGQTPAPAGKPVLTLEEIYSEYNVIDADISPSGKMIAAAIRREADDMVVVLDLTTGQRTPVTRINKDAFGDQIDVRMGFVRWKTDNRLLLQLRSRTNEGVDVDRLARTNILKLGKRLYGVDRDGKNLTPMFGKQYEEELVGAFDTSNIASMLWNDPQHILVKVGGWEGRSLFKLDVTTGKGKIVEQQKESVVDWWLDTEGNPVGRIEYSAGTLRFYRKLEDGKWKKYYSARRSDFDGEQPELSQLAPSSDPNKFYVLSRPEGKERFGIYLYDMQKESFGDPLVENPEHDIVGGMVSSNGARLMYYCYEIHVTTCEFSDLKQAAYMRDLRKHFKDNSSVFVKSASDDGKIVLLSVGGPSDPPAYYYFRVEERKLEFLGLRQGALKDRALPKTAVITYKTRDGQQQTGYLTYPPGGENAKGLPLVLMPHGGPQVRDLLEYNPWVQYLAGRGYAVFQPNYRGSGGFSKTFEYSGHREWGRKMQDDLGDGVKALVDQGTVDPARVCIVGASYGGYAALAGATLTPEAYKCAVAMAGVGDLEEFVRWVKKKHGADSAVATHWVRVLGDPDKDQAAMRASSPAFHIDAVKIPVLLVHGADDEIVPYSQSESFQKLMNKSGRKTELLKLKNEGHGDFEKGSSKVMLSTIGVFLWENLGKGYGVNEPPMQYVFK